MLNNTNIINALSNKGFTNVSATSVVKNGVTLTGFAYRPEGSNIGATVYTDDCKTDDEAIARCADLFSKAMPDVGNPFENFDKSRLTASIFAKGNSGSDLAKPFLDLEICPYYVVVDNGEEVGAIKLTSNIIDFTGMDVKTLYDTAIANAFTDCSVRSIGDVLSELTGCPAFMFDCVPMWVVSNAKRVNGAVNIANTDALAKLADDLDSDLYILPSSRHEVLALPTSEGAPDMLRQMVGEVNCTECTAEDVLCENVYLFTRKTKTVTVA